MNRSAILLSGGMDSAALAYWKRPEIAITVNYGQLSAEGEVRAAAALCSELGMAHEIISVDCSALGSGDLSGVAALEIAPESEWWPYRNQLLITLAAMRGIALGVGNLLVGSIRSDSFHADGKKEFYDLADRIVRMQEGSMRISAPAIEYDAIGLIRKSGIPVSLLAWTHSCHKAAYACGNCRGCNKARNIFASVLE